MIAIDVLERFGSEIRASNSVIASADGQQILEMLDIMEAVIAQLRSGIAERGLIVALNDKLKKFAVWAGSKFMGKGLEKLAESAVDWTGKF